MGFDFVLIHMESLLHRASLLRAVIVSLAFGLLPLVASARSYHVDVDGDGEVTIADVNLVVDYLIHGGEIVTENDGYVSAADYGAVGDGKTDDTSALEALFADAVALKKAVYIPAGTYLIHRPLTIKSGMEIYGDGDASIIKKIPAAWHMLTDDIEEGVYNADSTITVKVDGISGYAVGDHCYISYSSSPLNPAMARARFCTYGEIAAINETPIIEDGKTKYEVIMKSAYADVKLGVVYKHPAGAVLSTSFPILRSWGDKDECVNVYIHDICLDGNRQAYNSVNYEPMEWTNACIHFDAYSTLSTNGIPYNHHSYNHIVERCRLINASFDAVSDQGEGGLIVKDCVIENCAMHGVHMGTTFANAFITNNKMTGNGVRGAGVFFCQSVTNVIVDNNEITAFNHGCSDEEYGTCVQYAIIRNNTFKNITSYVFDFMMANSVVRGGSLQISNNKVQGLKDLLFSGDYLDDVVISNNVVKSVTRVPASLIKVVESKNVIVVGNTLPSGVAIGEPVDATNTENLIQASNSWDS